MHSTNAQNPRTAKRQSRQGSSLRLKGCFTLASVTIFLLAAY